MIKFRGLHFTLIEALVTVLLVSGLAFAAIDIMSSDLTTANITVNATATVYSHSFQTDAGSTSAIAYVMNSTTGNITMQLEQSLILPGTEGSADLNYTIPVSLSNIASNLTQSGTWYQQSVSPIALPYGRLKMTGGGGNAATTTIRAKFNQDTFR